MVRLPIVNSDDGTWGSLLRDWLKKEHYNHPSDADDPDNGKHQMVNIRPGTSAAGTAPLKIESGTNLTTPEAGTIEYDGEFHITPSSGTRTEIVGRTNAQTLTNKTLTEPRMNIVKGLNGNNLLDLWDQSGAVNYFLISNRAAGSTPYIESVGSDTNINIGFAPKGTGFIQLWNNTPTIVADGPGGNKNLNLVTSGTGVVQANGVAVVTTSGAQVLTNKTLTSPVISTISNSGTVTIPTGTQTLVGRTTSDTLTNKTLTNPNVNNYVEGTVAVGTVTTSHTFDLTNGTLHTATLTASTACTFTMPTAGTGKSFTLLLKQAPSTGNGTATFTNVRWAAAGAPTITPTAGRMDIFTFVSDGANWYGSFVQGYTP